MFDLTADGNESVDLRAYLRRGNSALSERDRKYQRSPAEQIGSVTHMALTPSLILIGYLDNCGRQ